MPAPSALSTLTRRAGVAASATLLLSGVGAAAHAATPPPTITVHVENAAHEALPDIAVYAWNAKTGGYVDFGTTDAAGDIAPTRGTDGRLTAGNSWSLVYYDASADRWAAQSSYVGREIPTPIAAGANDLGDVALTAGSSVEGTIRSAGSHTALADLGYLVLPAGSDPAQAQFGSGTEPTGLYGSQGLEVGSYDVFTQAGKTYRKAGTIELTEPGQHLQADYAVQVKPSAKRLTATSPARGKATVTFVVDGLGYGLPAPGGTITITAGTKDLGTFDVVPQANGKGRAVAALTGLRSGGKTLKVAYSSGPSGDLLDVSATVPVTVR